MKTRKKVIIVDPVHPYLIESLKKKYLVNYSPNISYESLSKIIFNYNIIILRSGIQLDKKIIELAKELKVIVRAGVGMDNIDIITAKKKNIKYFNVPAQSSSSVAELAFGLAHSSLRKISYCDRSLRKNMWRKSEMYGYELMHKNLGLIGFGKIGQKIANLSKAYKMKVFATVKNQNKNRKKILLRKKIFLVSLNALLKNSDVVVVAIPLTKNTRNLINKKNLKFMKSNSILVNVSRGGIVNEIDLFNHLKNKKIFSAATDVFLIENKKSKLFKLDNITLTSHIGAMTFEAQKRIAVAIKKKLFKMN